MSNYQVILFIFKTLMGVEGEQLAKAAFVENDGKFTVKDVKDIENIILKRVETEKGARDGQRARGIKEKAKSVEALLKSITGVEVNEKEQVEDYINRAIPSYVTATSETQAQEIHAKWKEGEGAAQGENFSWDDTFKRPEAADEIKKTAVFRGLEQKMSSSLQAQKLEYEQKLLDEKSANNQRINVRDFKQQVFMKYLKDNPPTIEPDSKPYLKAVSKFEEEALKGINVKTDADGNFYFEKEGKRLEDKFGVEVTPDKLIGGFYDTWFDRKADVKGTLPKGNEAPPNGGSKKYATLSELDEAFKKGEVKLTEYQTLSVPFLQ